MMDVDDENITYKYNTIRIALICQSNYNRSMEAHYQLQKNGYEAWSYGVGSKIKIPGVTRDNPNEYSFGATRYEQIRNDLMSQNEQHYRERGLLQMVERNLTVKDKPEKWQLEAEMFDVVITFEQRVYDIVLQDINDRKFPRTKPVFVINLETPDNDQSARVSGQVVLNLVQQLYSHEDSWEEELPKIIDNMIAQQSINFLYMILFY